MKRFRRRSNLKSDAQKKRQDKEKAAQAHEKTQRRVGLGRGGTLKGATSSPLVTKGWERKPRPAPTSDRGPMKDLIHEHKWKRGSEEKAATVEEISRKTTLIGPAYNKRAVQYLPS